MLFVFCVLCVCVCVCAGSGRTQRSWCSCRSCTQIWTSSRPSTLSLKFCSSSCSKSTEDTTTSPSTTSSTASVLHRWWVCVCVCVCVCICIIERLFIRANHSELNCVCNHEIVQLRHQLRANWWRTSSLQGQEVTVVIYPRHPWRRTLRLSYPLHIFFWRLIFLFDQCYLFCK